MRKLEVSEWLLMIEADIHGPPLDDGKSAELDAYDLSGRQPFAYAALAKIDHAVGRLMPD